MVQGCSLVLLAAYHGTCTFYYDISMVLIHRPLLLGLDELQNLTNKTLGILLGEIVS